MQLNRIATGILATAFSLALASSASADRILIDLGGGARQASGQWDSYLSATPPPPSTVGELFWNA